MLGAQCQDKRQAAVIFKARKILNMRVVEHRNSLPREAMKSLSMNILKTQLDMVFGKVFSLIMLKH